MTRHTSKGSYQDYIDGDYANKVFKFRLIKKNGASSIRDYRNNPIIYVGSHTIPNTAIINEIDRKSGKMTQRVIRYLPGESSIYKDEQSPDKDVPKKPFVIEFINGHKSIKGSDNLFLDFMMKANQNATNPHRKTDVTAVFELVDNSILVSKEIAKDKLMSEVTAWCWNGDFDEVQAYARVLNVPLDQTPDEIRHHLKLIAVHDPEKFMKELKNPEMRKKHYVLEAIDRGYLILDTKSNTIAWSNNLFEPIAVAASGISPVDVLVRKLSTDEGMLVYQTIVSLLTPEPVITTKMVVPNADDLAKMKTDKIVVQEPLPLVDESDAELMAITNEGIELKVITFAPPMWYKFMDEAGKKKEGFVEKLKKNPAMLKSLRFEIDRAKRAVPTA